MNKQNDCHKRREAITAFALGELEHRAADELKKHIDTCETCRSLYHALVDEEETIRSAFQAIADRSEILQNSLVKQLDKQDLSVPQIYIRSRKTVKVILSAIMKSRITKLAAAAVIVTAVILALQNGSIDIVSSAFGVEDVIAAMQKAEWVHCVMKIEELNVDAETAEKMGISGWESWQSVHPSRSIEKHDSGKIYFTEKDIGRTSRYDPETNRITVEYKHPSSSQETYASIADMHIKQTAELEKAGAKVKYKEGVYKGRPVKIINIDFTSDSGLHTIVSTVVDPETHLPQKFTAQQTSSKKGLHGTISGIFDYPENAPKDIYQAGAPLDAQVKIIDERAPEFLEAIKPYRAARENLPQHIVLEVETNKRGTIRTICVVYNDGVNERFERIKTNIKSDNIPADKNFDSLLIWASNVKTDSIGIQLYDGEYIYRARCDYEGFWTLREKEYSPKRNWHSFAAGLTDHGWPEYVMYQGKVIKNSYSRENSFICIEKQNKPIFEGDKLRYPAEKTLYYINPQRDYMCVRKEQFQHRLPPHDDPIEIQKLDFAPDDIPSEPYSITEVVEFGQTDAGQWYPKKIRLWSRNRFDRGYGWETSEEIKIITLYLKINPEFPDGIFDPNNLVPTGAKIRKEGEKTTFERYFEQAITVIDSRQYWPEPEELVKIYWQARAKKDYEEMAILWPGSASWNSKVLENEKPVEYVFGEVRKAGDNRVIVPYAAKSYYEKNGTYNLKMWLDNKKSTKGRYYIISGN